MTGKRYILFVEDNALHRDWIRQKLHDSEQWDVIACEEAEDVLEHIRARQTRGQDFPAVVSVDLGLGDMPHEPDRGLALLERLRKTYPGLRLAVHSALPMKDGILHRVLACGASYFLLGDAEDLCGYVQLLPYVAKGYVVYSPSAAGRLVYEANAKADPFCGREEYWDTLKWLAEGYTQKQIAQLASLTEAGVKYRVHTIYNILVDQNRIANVEGELGPDGYKPFLVQWYRDNHHLYLY